MLCCQVLEHLPFEKFRKCVMEIRRVTRVGGITVISLPDLTRTYKIAATLPKLGEVGFLIPINMPEIFKTEWKYNGEHYWNIGNKGYPSKRILKMISEVGFKVEKNYRVFEMSWHRFIIARAF